MPSTWSESGSEMLSDAAQAVAARLVQDPERRRERLGEIFLACQEVAEQAPDAFLRAQHAGTLETFLVTSVRDRLIRSDRQTFSGGWLGVYVDESGRALESSEEDNTDPEALETSRRALARAISLAQAEGNETLLRNLSWYEQRLSHRSYDAIAQAEGRVTATVRTGVARARKFVLRVVHELRHGQPAPLSGEAPLEVEPLRQLWFQQKLDELAAELERTREGNQDNPHWLNLAGLLAADRGQRAEAVSHYEHALVHADAPSVRGRVLNNFGNLYDDHGCREEARSCWLRAHQLAPHAPAPLLNLLASASRDEDYPSAQHYVAELADLLNSGRLTAGERSYLQRRLRENPKLAWLRETDLWSQGPARWLRGNGRAQQTRTLRCAVLAVFGGLALGVALLWPLPATAAVTPRPTAITAVSAELPSWLVAKRRGGGDSMGKPARRFETLDLIAGDSMGRKGSRPGGGRPPKKSGS